MVFKDAQILCNYVLNRNENHTMKKIDTVLNYKPIRIPQIINISPEYNLQSAILPVNKVVLLHLVRTRLNLLVPILRA